MKKRFWLVGAAMLAAVIPFSLCGCSAGDVADTLLSADETYEKKTSAEYTVSDSAEIYRDLEEDVITMYLTVGQGNEEDGTDHTWTEVNDHPLSYYDSRGIAPYACEALLQVGDEFGPLKGKFGYGELTANASVRLRGQGASEQTQKSYRIDIKKNKGNWKDQKVVVLNKHAADPVRIRNKLAYDLMAEIPQMFSTRTWFVHLYVKDRTEGENGLFEDYGLYTAVEQINSRYLKNRNLSSGGNLYKAVDFDWRPHEDALKLATSTDFNEAAFEQLLENKGDVDHTKLLNLLNAVNNENESIWEITGKYFDRDNLFYWMAFHILMGNQSVGNTNYYLFSPQGVDRWYILSWDNDAILPNAYKRIRDPEYDPAWNHGIFSLVSASLYERMLKDADCREALDEAVEDLRANYLTRENVNTMAETYAGRVKDMVYSLPDRMHEPVSTTNYDVLVGAMADEVEENYEAYRRSLEEPWPFHILEPSSDGTMLKLRWEESFVYGGGTPAYTVELSANPMFTDKILDLTDQTDSSYSMEMLPPGQYFLRVRAVNGRYSQGAYEYYYTETEHTITGTMCFYVSADGSVQVNRYMED